MSRLRSTTAVWRDGRLEGSTGVIGFIVQRTLTAIPVLFLVSLITFGLIQLVPGDPAVVIAGQDATAAELARVREMRPSTTRSWTTPALTDCSGMSTVTVPKPRPV